MVARFFGEPAQLLVHALPVRRPRIDGEADRGAAEPQRVLDARGLGGRGVVLVAERVVIVHLEDQGNLARVVVRDGLDESVRRRVRVAARLDRELHVVVRIIAGRVGREVVS